MKKKVAIQGIRASFHEQAAFSFFGEDIQTVECNSFRETCEALKNKQCDYTVMAIENSIAGSILPNYALLRDFHFTIIGEVYLPIQLHLLALPGVKFEDVKYVESHPIAIRQCDDFFDAYPQLQVRERNDTAACAKRIREEQLTDTVAIANILAAKLYDLEILERRIESNKKNFTRFLVLSDPGNAEAIVENPDKASLSFQVGNEIGSLARILNIFSEENINLSKIQSMPVLGKRNEYNFYVDVEWQERRQYETALHKVLRYAVNFTNMGEYRKNEEA
ncbi:prephenate dehydratase [Hufsiella ginkgonis]|uniref:prephenate dehydratase n=1 Tax=Hufsiella ginkgonis TaxID=2695274 RepID=A0A7K1Y388_9SPHI|nr:prephenate dehydratase [Hufsiella ginkgonis]MXV17764.1 prephenate dehydratase [Hufsiella ginkgonis]